MVFALFRSKNGYTLCSFWFGIGYLTHWIADSLTPSGVPISQFDNHRIHFFGGKIKTGSMPEYILSFGFLLLVISFTQPFQNLDFQNLNFRDSSEKRYDVYQNNYKKLFENKMIDAKTYKENRFNLF